MLAGGLSNYWGGTFIYENKKKHNSKLKYFLNVFENYFSIDKNIITQKLEIIY